VKLRINGETVDVSDDLIYVSDLLKHFQLHDKIVIVEHNKDILEKSTHEKVRISDGDQIEIVHFVGGG
jgi:sulfur carrier protein